MTHQSNVRRNNPALAVCRAVVALTILTSACATTHTRSTRESEIATTAAVNTQSENGAATRTRFSELLVDTLTQRLIAVELREVTDCASGLSQTPVARNITSRSQLLWTQLGALPVSDRRKQISIHQVADAMEQRRASVVLDGREQSLMYTPQNPLVQANALEEKLLIARRSQLEADARALTFAAHTCGDS